MPVDEFFASRAGSHEERLRRLEDWAATFSGRQSRSPATTAQAAAIGGTGTARGGTGGTLIIPESQVIFDPIDGHDHDGVDSRLIRFGTAGASTEVDFGAVPTRYGTFTIVDATVVAGTRVMIVQSAEAATGKSQDENECDPLLCRAVAGSGSFTVYVTALEGPVTGKFRLSYLVGT